LPELLHNNSHMELKDFSYFLPDELIAQHPGQKRDHSRLLFLDKRKEATSDLFFFQLPDLLQSGDVLVINDSRVIPARLFGRKQTGGYLEILLLTRNESEKDFQTWEALLRPAKRLRENDVLALGNNCEAKVLARLSDKKWLLKFFAPDGFDAYLNKFGRAPLPPYIKRRRNNHPDVADLERYQTIYAKNPGSIAAPTAGLHFSEDVMNILRSKGVQIAPITLHVGYGTFLPIESDEVEKHVLEPEYYEINPESVRIINNAGRIIAVGTTSTRTLESAVDNNGYVNALSGFTNLFIYPGYKFKRVNGLLTNFHLPQSSLFLLTCAFAGTDLMKKTYSHAVKNHYMFYSYGDCMLIL
jgi:S-adenosylmethionine:tRNA ribosyltransferase-isomerase